MNKEVSIGGALIACFLASNLTVAVLQELLTAPPYSNALVAAIEGFAIGAMFAQVVILAIWSGLSPDKTLLRSLLGCLVLVTMAVSISGFVNTFTPRVNYVRQSWGAERYTWLVFVFLYASVQILFMIHRRWKGYWLSLNQLEFNQVKRRTFSVAELVAFPCFFCIPLITLTALLESLSPTHLVISIPVLLLACTLYAALHLLAFLGDRVSTAWLSLLLVLCPLALLPASLVITGSLNGSIFGVPFVLILCFIHLGALAIGIPTAAFARYTGYRIHRQELAT